MIEENKLLTLFKKDVLKKNGIERHPKADELYNIALDWSYSSGLGELADTVRELSVLLK